MTNNYDIFISYRDEGGRANARNIQLALESRGYHNIFFSYDSLTHGQFEQQLISAVQHCKDFILLLSEGALDQCDNENDNVALEIRTALSSQCNIIPVTVDTLDWKWPDNLPKDLYPLKKIQYTSLLTRKYFKDGIDEIVGRLSSKLNHTSCNSFIDICLRKMQTEEFKFERKFRDFSFNIEIKELNEFILLDYCRCDNKPAALSMEYERISGLSEEEFFKETNYVAIEGIHYALHGFSSCHGVECWGFPYFVISVDSSHVAIIRSPEDSDRAMDLTKDFYSYVSSFRLTKEQVCDCLKSMIDDPFACPDIMSIPGKSFEDGLDREASRLLKRIKEAKERIFFKPNSNPKFECYPNKTYYIGFRDMSGISLYNIRESASRESISEDEDKIIACYTDTKEIFVDNWQIEPLIPSRHIPKVLYEPYPDFSKPKRITDPRKKANTTGPLSDPGKAHEFFADFYTWLVEGVLSNTKMSVLATYESCAAIIKTDHEMVFLAPTPIHAFATHVVKFTSIDDKRIMWSLMNCEEHSWMPTDVICSGKLDLHSFSGKFAPSLFDTLTEQ